MTTHEQLIRAVQMATRKLASSGKNFDLLMKDVLAICVEAVGATGGTIYLHDPVGCRLKFQYVLPEEIADKLPTLDIPENFGMAGSAFQSRLTVCKSFPKKSEDEWNPFERATRTPVESMVATPLMMENEMPIGVVQLLNKEDGVFDETDCAVLDTIAAVSTMAYMNYKLNEESSRASTLLGMGKVGHDIGNLAASLYATLSFSEMALTGLNEELHKSPAEPQVDMYLESLNPMFDDLKLSVDRIVGYSQLISDMSAGRALRPERKLLPLSVSIQTSAAYLSTDARKNHVALRFNIDDKAPDTFHDELYIFRIVQNLVGNAIKAVKETLSDELLSADYDEDDPPVYGEVRVRYRFEDNTHFIEVSDSGPGMTQEKAARILSGTARSQWDKTSGSGWGMRIVLELAQTHDAKVSIDSEVGCGTTFRVAIPHCGN